MHVYRLYTYSSARPTCLSPYPGDDPPSPPAPVNPVIIKSRTIEQSVFRPTKAPNFGEKREREFLSGFSRMIVEWFLGILRVNCGKGRCVLSTCCSKNLDIYTKGTLCIGYAVLRNTLLRVFEVRQRREIAIL